MYKYMIQVASQVTGLKNNLCEWIKSHDNIQQHHNPPLGGLAVCLIWGGSDASLTWGRPSPSCSLRTEGVRSTSESSGVTTTMLGVVAVASCTSWTSPGGGQWKDTQSDCATWMSVWQLSFHTVLSPASPSCLHSNFCLQFFRVILP